MRGTCWPMPQAVSSRGSMVPSAQRHQARASVLLETVRATEHAGLSRALTAGLEARSCAAAEAIAQVSRVGGYARSRATPLGWCVPR